MVEHNLAKVGVASSNLVSRSKRQSCKTWLPFLVLGIMFETYIIHSESSDRYYVGSTGVGVRKRLERHNEGWTRSTKSGIPWALKYVCGFETKTEALQWENHIKRQKSRNYIEELIVSDGNECKNA